MDAHAPLLPARTGPLTVTAKCHPKDDLYIQMFFSSSFVALNSFCTQHCRNAGADRLRQSRGRGTVHQRLLHLRWLSSAEALRTTTDARRKALCTKDLGLAQGKRRHLKVYAGATDKQNRCRPKLHNPECPGTQRLRSTLRTR